MVGAALENNFVADVRLDESDEVLQLPIVKNRLKRLLTNAVKKIAMLGAPVVPSCEDTLEEFLQAAGKFFGKDPAEWVQMGEPQVTVTEDQGKRYIKSTGVFSGLELHMFMEPPYIDDRLPERIDKLDLNFKEKRRAIATDEQWQEIIRHQPWSMSVRRQMLTGFLQAKMDADDGELAIEGCHGMWELSIHKANHPDIRQERIISLLAKLDSVNIEVATLAGASVWGLALSASCRRSMAELDAVQTLLNTIKRALKVVPVPDSEDPKDEVPDGAITDSQRASLQRFLCGALSMLMVDRCCRRPYISLEPNFATLFLLCDDIEGYQPKDAKLRRETAAKVLTSLMQRDPDARRSLITTGSLRNVIKLLNPEGPGKHMVQFCMASLLATLVLDDEVMELVRERGEAPVFFEACLVLLTSTLDNLHEELDRQLGDYYQDDEQPAEYDLALGVRLGEASAQAMWGSAYMCVGMTPVQIKMEHVVELAKMGLDCVDTDQLPLSRVCHCVTATLASMASNADTADLLVTCPDNLALNTLLSLCEVTETENFERAGHVKASACAGIAFLTVHPLGAKGDECMVGPYRTCLLGLGAFGTLLRAALTSVNDEECDMIVQQAASIGLMYMSTMAGAVDAAELAMYAALLMDSNNSEMIEFLMAGMWILLRNPENRRCLGSSFSPNPASKVATGMMNKLNDAITLHEINDQAQEKAETMRQSMYGKTPVAHEVLGSDKGSQRHSSADVLEEDEASPGNLEPKAMEQESGTAGGLECEDMAGGLGEPVDGGELEESEQAQGEEGTAPASRPESSEKQHHNRRDARAVPPELADDEAALQAAKGGNDPGAARKRAQSAARGTKEGKDSHLVAKFDKQLKENWGLETLVTVGESWLPAMLEQDEAGEATDIPVLKLFEFLVASICLFMIEEDATVEPRELDLFKLTAPPGVRTRTWWTVDARAPELAPTVASEQARALGIMVKIVGMRLGAAWKSLQLGVLTMWNVCSMNANMERHVVEAGVCSRLLDIMNRSSWPPSLRDIAGGCLEFFAERSTNLNYFPTVGLPVEVDWPYPKPPGDGLVPTIAGYINLVNSKLPLLEYRGCHGLARICYAAPYGCEDPVGFVREAKAVAAVLGGIDGIVALMKRVNKRYQDIVTGKRLRARLHSTYGVELSDAQQDILAFEKDMSTLEAQQDIYFVLFAALLNMSVLRSVQPLVAKKGLLVLLGTNTMLYGRLAGGPSFVVPASEVEEKLLHLCSSIIQNIALHPQNRTRMYKAELKGGMALDRLIEDATGAEQDEVLSELAHMLPRISGSPKVASEPSSPARASTSLPGPRQRRTDSPATSSGGANERRTSTAAGGIRPSTQQQRPGTQQQSRPGTQQQSRPGTQQTRLSLSRNGAVLNASVDTQLAGTFRPKVLFPPIVEQREEEAYAKQPGMPAIRNNATMQRNATLTQSLLGATAQAQAQAEMAAGRGMAASSTASDTGDAANSKHRFMSWMDNTFIDEAGASGSPSDQAGRKKGFRKHMWDENGDWLENDPDSAKALNRILCRPITHLWMESPEARSRQGKARWEPTISEYQEATSTTPLGRSAAKLLATQPPTDERDLMLAATQLMTTGSHNLTNEEDSMPIRPGTAQRHTAKMCLTVLKPNPEALKDWRDKMGSTGDGSFEDEEALAEMAAQEAAKKAGKGPAVTLKVALGPKRARQVISFEDRIIANDVGSRPMLTMFEHVEGSRVCKDMFPSYQLPNGKQTFMYYNGGTLLDEVRVDAVNPPPRPSTVPAALQQTMPLADVLNLISKPPGSAPPFIPYKPVPYLVPLPPKHTLTVKRPDLLTSSAIGDLREDNLQLIIHAKKILKTHVTTRVETIEVAKPEYREPWVLPNSIFKPRVKECDSHNFFDTDAVEEKMFERDWQRACTKEKFTAMLARENKANKTDPKEDKVMLQEVHDVLLQYYKQWYSTFIYYAGGGSGSDPYHMPLNAFTTFLDDCHIADSESQSIKRSDCDTIFIVCNFQPDKKSPEAQFNLENALMRFEFLEVLVRAALAKYGKGQATEDVAEAVRMLLEQNLLANIPPGASIVTNDFRTERLYCEEVDLLLKRHSVMLKAIYSRYRLKPQGGGLRPKVVKLDGWQQLMNDAKLVDSQFTIQDTTIAYLWSRMMVVDEIKDYPKYTSLTFVDFLEALGRVADMKSLPLESDLEASGYNNILEWHIDKERMEGNPEQRQSEAHDGEAAHHNAHDVFRNRDSAGFAAPKSRPLYAKLELLLDLMFRRLFWDPSTTEIPFNYDALLKLIKKVDKDMGP